MNDAILQNKVKAVNNLYKALNKHVPELIAELNKGFKFNQDGRFDKRTQERLNPIIKCIYGKNKALRAYIDFRYNYTKYLFADVTYQVGEFTVNYFKVNTPILDTIDGKWNILEYEPFKPVTFAGIKSKLNKISITEGRISKLNSELSKLKRQALL